jgi:prepilin-type N-terminal cleavage/methylation domain-containing protein
MRRALQGGFTLVELMVSLVVVSIAVGFTFHIYSTSASAYHSQQRISELQQSLRTAKDVVVKDIRMAGYVAAQIHDLPAGAVAIPPFGAVDNADGTGPDTFTIAYADMSCSAHIKTGGPAFNSAESSVDSTSCFQTGDIAFAVRVPPAADHGQGCVLEITNVQPNAGGTGHLQHHPAAPWNDNQNHQCDNISANWSDGNTVFTKFTIKTYRIAPPGYAGYQRGILQVNATGGVDPTAWQDLAYGFTDMQIAMRVYDPAGIDLDGDGDPLRNWYSGANMNNVLSVAGRELLQVRLTLVARTTWPIDGVMSQSTPDLSGAPAALNNNSIGDEAPTALVDAAGQPAITDKNDRRWGQHIFRSSTSLIDMRNLGVGH